MAKIFTTNGNGASQTLNEASSNRIKVFAGRQSIDTSTLANGEIVATSNEQELFEYVDAKVEEAKPKNWDWSFTEGKVEYGDGDFHIRNFIVDDAFIKFDFSAPNSTTRTLRNWYEFFDYLEQQYNIARDIPQSALLYQSLAFNSSGYPTNFYTVFGCYYVSNEGWRFSRWAHSSAYWLNSYTCLNENTSSDSSRGAFNGHFIFTRTQ